LLFNGNGIRHFRGNGIPLIDGKLPMKGGGALTVSLDRGNGLQDCPIYGIPLINCDLKETGYNTSFR